MQEPGRRKWRCRTCSALYDEAHGLPEDGIAPGTPFENLSDGWQCPYCGAPKSDFELIAE
jgi:rubredoxin